MPGAGLLVPILGQGAGFAQAGTGLEQLLATVHGLVGLGPLRRPG